jgi:hypothetical protein
MAAHGRDCLNCALEAVEGMSLPVDLNFKALVVFIPANFASGHLDSWLSFVPVKFLALLLIETHATENLIGIWVRNTGQELHIIGAEGIDL